MEVLALSMPRTATTSMVVALQMLGHEHVYHGYVPPSPFTTSFLTHPPQSPPPPQDPNPLTYPTPLPAGQSSPTSPAPVSGPPS